LARRTVSRFDVDAVLGAMTPYRLRTMLRRRGINNGHAGKQRNVSACEFTICDLPFAIEKGVLPAKV
jgi:hypothetical protein